MKIRPILFALFFISMAQANPPEEKTLLFIKKDIAECVGYRPPRDGKDQKEMTKILTEWANVAPFPDDRGNYQIITGGSAFTRAFQAYFTLKPDPLNKWIRDSKLEKSFKQEDGGEVYEPAPGGDAGYSKIIIYRDLCLVIVYAYWS